MYDHEYLTDSKHLGATGSPLVRWPERHFRASVWLISNNVKIVKLCCDINLMDCIPNLLC